jgi:CDP-diacylglycerol--serine O-phosphatidyltransferase
MVSLGTAPAVLAFIYLYNNDVAPWYVIGPLCVFFVLAGAYRLARFNLLPPKASGGNDSAGLTITSGGAHLALAVLSELTLIRWQISPFWLLPLLFLLALLMVSTIPFPSFVGVFSSKKRTGTLILLFTISLIISPLSKAWFFWNNLYLGWSVVRAGYHQMEGK